MRVPTGSRRRPPTPLLWVPAGGAAVIAAYFAGAALAWCWSGAYNLLQGPHPAYHLSLLLAVLGVVPLLSAGLAFRLRRRRAPAPHALGRSALVTVACALVVLLIRAFLGGGS